MGVGHPNKKLDNMAQKAIDDMNRPGPSRSTVSSGSSRNRGGSNNTKVKDDSGFWLMLIIIFVAVGLFMKFF